MSEKTRFTVSNNQRGSTRNHEHLHTLIKREREREKGILPVILHSHLIQIYLTICCSQFTQRKYAHESDTSKHKRDLYNTNLASLRGFDGQIIENHVKHISAGNIRKRWLLLKWS